MDRLVFNSSSPPPVTGPAYMDNIAEKINAIFNTLPLRPTSIVNVGNDYTIEVDPVLIGDVTAGMSFYIQPNANNTGPVRLRITGSNPYYDVVKSTGDALALNDFSTNIVFFVVFINGEFRIMSVAADAADVGAILVYQEFLTSGVWTKPVGINPDAWVDVEIWGGGGGGGGGGGAYTSRKFRAADLTSSVVVTIGNGGSTTGNGGNTAFGSYLLAYGGFTGASGASSNAGGGGGLAANGGPKSGGSAVVYNNTSPGLYGGEKYGGNPINVAPNVGISTGAIFGGGGQGRDSIYGGGGGWNGTSAGISIYGGNGGGNGVAGAVPGGGGGTSAVGGAGKCIVRLIG